MPGEKKGGRKGFRLAKKGRKGGEKEPETKTEAATEVAGYRRSGRPRVVSPAFRSRLEAPLGPTPHAPA